MKYTLIIISLILLFAPYLGAETKSSSKTENAEQIIKKMDENLDYTTIKYNAEMTIFIGDKIRTKELTAEGVSEGNKAIVTFTNPSDKGTKYLLIGENLWIYFPEENEVVKISGHMLKEGMMGSDFSYEDALESQQLSDKYDINLICEETVNDRLCYVLDLTAVVKLVQYFHRKMWIDKEYFICWKEEMYAKSGKLLKRAEIQKIKKIGNRYFPVKTSMKNMLRENSETVFEMFDIFFNEPVPAKIFSIRNLRK